MVPRIKFWEDVNDYDDMCVWFPTGGNETPCYPLFVSLDEEGKCVTDVGEHHTRNQKMLMQ
jgi:hypothetical protein